MNVLDPANGNNKYENPSIPDGFVRVEHGYQEPHDLVWCVDKQRWYSSNECGTTLTPVKDFYALCRPAQLPQYEYDTGNKVCYYLSRFTHLDKNYDLYYSPAIELLITVGKTRTTKRPIETLHRRIYENTYQQRTTIPLKYHALAEVYKRVKQMGAL